VKISVVLEYKVEAGEKTDELDGVAFEEATGVLVRKPSFTHNFLKLV
jgi:hypothetical protein